MQIGHYYTLNGGKRLFIVVDHRGCLMKVCQRRRSALRYVERSGASCAVENATVASNRTSQQPMTM